MISLKYALTKEDYSNYYTYVMWDAPGNKKKRVIYYTRQVLPLLLFLAAFYYTGLFNRPGNFILMIAAFFILTSILAFFGVRNNMMKQGEKVADDPDNSSVFLNLEVSVSDAGITIKDELNNDLTINGKINNQDYANLGFDMTVDADNFKAVNSKAKDNDTFYGELFLDNH